MPGFFNAQEIIVLGSLFGPFRADLLPDPLFLAASTTAPNEDGTGITEPVGLGYARVSVDTTNDFLAAALNGDIAETKSNSGLTFPAATGSWGTLTHWVLFNALTAGNPILFGTLTPPPTIAVNDQLRIPAQSLVITLD